MNIVWSFSEMFLIFSLRILGISYIFNYPGEEVTKLQAYIRQQQKAVTFAFFTVAFWQFTNNNLSKNKLICKFRLLFIWSLSSTQFCAKTYLEVEVID